MADTKRGVEWRLEGAEPLKGFLEWPERQYPFRKEQFNGLLSQAIGEAELQDRFRQEFIVTEPLWLGLWIDSPLTGAKCALLDAVLSKLGSEIRDIAIDGLHRLQKEHPTSYSDSYVRHCETAILRQYDNLTAFLVALRSAEMGNGTLYVEFTPPGHVDFDTFTVFAHCPRCKDWAPNVNWDEETRCPVCGHGYIPRNTMRDEKIDFFDGK